MSEEVYSGGARSLGERRAGSPGLAAWAQGRTTSVRSAASLAAALKGRLDGSSKFKGQSSRDAPRCQGAGPDRPRQAVQTARRPLSWAECGACGVRRLSAALWGRKQQAGCLHHRFPEAFSSLPGTHAAVGAGTKCVATPPKIAGYEPWSTPRGGVAGRKRKQEDAVRCQEGGNWSKRAGRASRSRTMPRNSRTSLANICASRLAPGASVAFMLAPPWRLHGAVREMAKTVPGCRGAHFRFWHPVGMRSPFNDRFRGSCSRTRATPGYRLSRRWRGLVLRPRGARFPFRPIAHGVP